MNTLYNNNNDDNNIRRRNLIYEFVGKKICKPFFLLNLIP